MLQRRFYHSKKKTNYLTHFFFFRRLLFAFLSWVLFKLSANKGRSLWSLRSFFRRQKRLHTFLNTFFKNDIWHPLQINVKTIKSHFKTGFILHYLNPKWFQGLPQSFSMRGLKMNPLIWMVLTRAFYRYCCSSKTPENKSWPKASDKNYGWYALDGMADLIESIREIKANQNFSFFILLNLYERRKKPFKSIRSLVFKDWGWLL